MFLKLFEEKSGSLLAGCHNNDHLVEKYRILITKVRMIIQLQHYSFRILLLKDYSVYSLIKNLCNSFNIRIELSDFWLIVISSVSTEEKVIAFLSFHLRGKRWPLPLCIGQLCCAMCKNPLFI